MRILILGSSTINKGAEAMLRTVQAELSRRIPGAKFFIGDHRARQWHAEGVVKAGVPLAPVDLGSRFKQARTLTAHALHAQEGPRYWIRERGRLGYIDALADFVDAAVDVSGFLFSDQRGERTSERLVHVAEAFSRRGKPFVFLPQAWGPFEGQAVRELTRRACAGADLVFARDTTSREHLEAILKSTNVEQAPDIAFLFQPATNGPELIAELGLDPERPIAAISPNMRVYERTDGEGENNHYCSSLVRVGRELMAGGAQLLLLPHEILPPKESRPDDRYLCRLLADALNSADVAAVTDDRTAEELKAMIGACDLMLGSRFHALIAALSSGVPAVAIGWAHKYPELLGEFGMERLVFDHDALAPDALVHAVMQVWDARGDYRAEISKRLPNVKSRSAAVFKRVAALFHSSHS